MTADRGYPYYEVALWAGRLPVPPAYTGTPVAKLFRSGKIGGKHAAFRETFADTLEGRRALVRWLQRHRDDEVEVDHIVSPRQHRVRVRVQVVLAPGFVERGTPEGAR
jgi:hypothetical protein